MKGTSSASPALLAHLPGGSPWCQSRLQEKEELRELNDCLATYIEGVQVREAGRVALKLYLAWQGKEEEVGSSGHQEGLLRWHYEGELTEM
ncbi:UNVERIFIED_CONTAM: hypothetical protein K2H54_045793 [Gekko kuhli]